MIRRSFGDWLDQHICSRVQPGRVELMNGGAPDAATECARYGALIADGGLDLALIGIGENGHLAFNDPHVADFEDPLVVKPVEIDDMSRHQQVRDGAFAGVRRGAPTGHDRDHVGDHGQPGDLGRGARPPQGGRRRPTLDGPIETACPASVLRRHPDAVLFVDEAALSTTPH